MVWLSQGHPSTLISKKYCLHILLLECWCFTCSDRNWRKILSHTLKTLVKNDTNHKGLPWNEKKTVDIFMFWFKLFLPALVLTGTIPRYMIHFLVAVLCFTSLQTRHLFKKEKKKKKTSISSWFRPRRWEFFFLEEGLGNCLIKGKNSRGTFWSEPASPHFRVLVT